MKSLKQICEDNITHPLYEVSILADIDDQINAYDNSIPDRIKKWIKENYKCVELKISKKPNENGLYEVSARSIEVKNRNITSFTNGMFEWKKINDFNCSSCTSLTSLVGAPKEVGGKFGCHGCIALKSLEGAPQKVGGDFNCFNCDSLTYLLGAPQKVGGNFNCSFCTSLTSLEHAPQEVEGYFNCTFCTSLKSLKGAPKKVGGNFYCYDCKTEFTIDDIINVSDVKGKIYF